MHQHSHLISSIGWSFGSHCAIISQLGLVYDELTFAFTKIFDLDTVIGYNKLSIDEEFNRRGWVFDLIEFFKSMNRDNQLEFGIQGPYLDIEDNGLSFDTLFELAHPLHEPVIV